MELREDLENRRYFVDIRQEPLATTRDIEDAMFLSEDFLQNITDRDGAFQKAIQPRLEYAKRIRNLAKTSETDDPYGIAQLRKLRAAQLKRMNRLQGRWEDLLQTARDFDESVTFRHLSEIIESTEEDVEEAWLNTKQLIDSHAENDTRRTPDTPPHGRGVPISFQSTAMTLQPEHKATHG